MPPKKKTTSKKMSMPQRMAPISSGSVTNSIPSPNAEIATTSSKNRFKKQKQLQKNMKKTKAISKGLIFGEKWVGKTHIGCSAHLMKGFEDDKFIYPSYCPVYVIDCNYSADIIAEKDFTEAYNNGDIIVVNAYIDQETGLPITDPIERVKSVRNLIDEISQDPDVGSLFIDGFDAVEEDAKHYIYRQFKIEEREDGTLWYLPKTERVNGQMKTVPPRPCNGIIQLMYTPRNNQIRAIMRKINNLQVPVIISAHSTVKFENNEATDQIISNLRPYVEDDMFYIVLLENDIVENKTKISGITNITYDTGRKMTIHKNRFQKGVAPDVRVMKKPKFEFSDIFSFLIEQ